MLRVLFFAQTRELIGLDAIEVNEHFATAEELRQHLAAKGDKWALALQSDKLFVAINQTLMPLQSDWGLNERYSNFRARADVRSKCRLSLVE